MKGLIPFYARVNEVIAKYPDTRLQVQDILNWASSPERVSRLINAMYCEMGRCKALERKSEVSEHANNFA